MIDTSISTFDKNSEYGQVLFSWWGSLQKHHSQFTGLKHCKTLDQVFLCQGFWSLVTKLIAKESTICNKKLALIAGILSKVTNHIPGLSIPRQMASVLPGRWSHPLVSHSRFMRLLMINSMEDLYKSFSENLQLICYSADIFSLANDLNNWGDSIKKFYAMEYFFKAPEIVFERNLNRK